MDCLQLQQTATQNFESLTASLEAQRQDFENKLAATNSDLASEERERKHECARIDKELADQARAAEQTNAAFNLEMHGTQHDLELVATHLQQISGAWETFAPSVLESKMPITQSTVA